MVKGCDNALFLPSINRGHHARFAQHRDRSRVGLRGL